MVALLVGAGAFVFGHARAATSVLGPVSCVRLGPNGSSGLEYTPDGVKNVVEGRSVDVVCSLFRDNTTNTNGMQDLEVSINDPSDLPGGLTCTAYSFDRQGVIKKQLEKKATTRGNVILDWGGSINVSVSRGHYAIKCTLPTQAILKSIFYTEP